MSEGFAICIHCGKAMANAGEECFGSDTGFHDWRNSREACAVPPFGWSCHRPSGHDGPCAATPAADPLCASEPKNKWEAVCVHSNCGKRKKAHFCDATGKKAIFFCFEKDSAQRYKPAPDPTCAHPDCADDYAKGWNDAREEAAKIVEQFYPGVTPGHIRRLMAEKVAK